MLKLITKAASVTFLLALMLASEANAESRLPPCPADDNTPWTNCYGTYTWPNGDKYAGEWKDGKRNGQGTYTWANGAKYAGEWKAGERSGEDIFMGVAILLLLIGTAIAVIDAVICLWRLWRKDRTEALNRTEALIRASIRASSPTTVTKIPATELVESDLENGPRPVGDAEMDAWRAALEPPRPHQAEQVVQQPSPISVSQASELIQALERLSQVREKGILTDAEFEQEKKRILVD